MTLEHLIPIIAQSTITLVNDKQEHNMRNLLCEAPRDVEGRIRSL
jgi:hypothetical protein